MECDGEKADASKEKTQIDDIPSQYSLEPGSRSSGDCPEETVSDENDDEALRQPWWQRLQEALFC